MASIGNLNGWDVTYVGTEVNVLENDVKEYAPYDVLFLKHSFEMPTNGAEKILLSRIADKNGKYQWSGNITYAADELNKYPKNSLGASKNNYLFNDFSSLADAIREKFIGIKLPGETELDEFISKNYVPKNNGAIITE